MKMFCIRKHKLFETLDNLRSGSCFPDPCHLTHSLVILSLSTTRLFPIVSTSLVQIWSVPYVSYKFALNGQGIALRGLFIIDKEGIIQHSTINNLAIGRSVDETMRTLQVIIFYWYRNQLKSHLDAVGSHPTTWPPHIQWVLRVEF